MRLKMIMAFVNDEKTDEVIEAARAAGATGATVITGVRGEGLKPGKTFMGLDLTAQRDVVLVLVADMKAREILETISEVAGFDEEAGAGVAIQVSIEDAVGLTSQAAVILHEIEEEL